MIEIFPRTKKDYEDLKGFETEILDLDFLRESPANSGSQ